MAGNNLIWTNATLEPKRKFRYVLEIASIDNITFLAQTCDRPGFKVGATPHKYFDKEFYHPGRVTWEPNPITVKLVDIQRGGGSGTDTNESLIAKFAESGLSGIILDSGAVKTVGKGAATQALGEVNIRVLNSALDALPTAAPGGAAGGGGGTLEAGTAELWTLKNCWLESIKPDALDYGSEDLLTVTVAIRYDWAEFKAHGATAPVIPFG
jgi:hypothetical protein